MNIKWIILSTTLLNFTLWSQNILPWWWCHLEPEATTCRTEAVPFWLYHPFTQSRAGLIFGGKCMWIFNIWGLEIILSVNTEGEELMCHTAANHKGAIWPNFSEKTLRILQICSENLKLTVFKNRSRNDPKFRCIGIFRAALNVFEKLGLCGGRRKWEGSVVSDRKYQSRIFSSRTLERWRRCRWKQEVKTGTVSSGGDEHEGLTWQFWSGLSRPDRRMP